MNTENKEIEKKFLIEFPGEALLKSIPEDSRSRIVQTYLLSEEGTTLRVRKREYPDTVKYTRTEKKFISGFSSYEDEREISKEEYLDELKMADPGRSPVEKERLLLKSGGHLFEIDIYPFWSDKAIMEVELGSEDEEFSIPDEIKVIKDVTFDKRYKNAAIARAVPEE